MTEDPLPRGRRDAPAAAYDLGEDIIAAEILQRLPVKSMLRFKSVCRSWRVLISDPSFVAAHMNRSKNRRRIDIEGYAISIDRICRLSPCRNHATRLFGMEFGDNEQVNQYSNGLMLMCTARELVVCNPSTREHRFLPHGSPCMLDSRTGSCKHAVAGFGFVAGEDVYKAARYVNQLDGRGFIEVLTLGIDSSWRAVAVDPPYKFDALSNPISTSGSVLYFSFIIRGRFIVRPFDLKSEKFGVIQVPPLCPSNGDYWFQALDGALCLTERDAGRVVTRVWVYKGDGATTHAWNHAFTIRLPHVSTFPSYIVGSTRGGKLLICTSNTAERRGLAYYDPGSTSLARVADLDETSFVRPLRYRAGFQVIGYVESLMPVPGGFPCICTQLQRK